VLLYHFTDPVHWDQIFHAGRLDPEASNWTDDDTPKVLHLSRSEHVGTLPATHWGCVVRLLVDVDDDSVTNWIPWASAHGVSGLNYGGNGGDSREWWVSAAPIPSERWIEVARCEWLRIWPE